MIKEDELALIFESCFMDYNLLNNNLKLRMMIHLTSPCETKSLNTEHMFVATLSLLYEGSMLSFKCVKN